MPKVNKEVIREQYTIVYNETPFEDKRESVSTEVIEKLVEFLK